jgi:hypothetical protein
VKVGDLVEANFDRRLPEEKPLMAIVVGNDKTRGWINVRFIDDARNGKWAHHSYPWGKLRLISTS